MKILFVCTGNICRSAMAESLFNHHARQLGLEIKAHSSGTDAISGNNATDLAVDVLADRGIDLKDHRAQQLTSDQIADSQIVIAMTRQHEAVVAKEDQLARSRTFLTGEISRIGSQIGPLQSQNLADWLQVLNEARGGHMTTGRLRDEIADPWGQPRDIYEQTAKRLEGHITHLVRLLSDDQRSNG